MSFMRHQPRGVVDGLRGHITAQFATLSATSAPIDTPSSFFPSASLGAEESAVAS